jgi:hypothetical protein
MRQLFHNPDRQIIIVVPATFSLLTLGSVASYLHWLLGAWSESCWRSEGSFHATTFPSLLTYATPQVAFYLPAHPTILHISASGYLATLPNHHATSTPALRRNGNERTRKEKGDSCQTDRRRSGQGEEAVHTGITPALGEEKIITTDRVALVTGKLPGRHNVIDLSLGVRVLPPYCEPLSCTMG